MCSIVFRPVRQNVHLPSTEQHSLREADHISPGIQRIHGLSQVQLTKWEKNKLSHHFFISLAKSCHYIHRSFTDLKRDHVLFSFSTPTSPNSILIIWDKAQSELEAYVKDNLAQYNGLDDKPNTWHSICTTWSVAEGLLQVWFDGQPLIRKYVKVGAPIMGNSVIIVGQV